MSLVSARDGGGVSGAGHSFARGAVPPESGLLADDGRRSTAARFAGDLRDGTVVTALTQRVCAVKQAGAGSSGSA